MAGILESFFRICMVLTIMLIGANLMLSQFSYAMTGRNTSINIDSNFSDFTLDSNVYYDSDSNTVTYRPTIYGTNIIEQFASIFVRPIIDAAAWATGAGFFGDFIMGWQKVILFIFIDIEMADGDMTDGVVDVAGVIILLMTVFQVIGAAYIPFALLSAFTGGGGP